MLRQSFLIFCHRWWRKRNETALFRSGAFIFVNVEIILSDDELVSRSQFCRNVEIVRYHPDAFWAELAVIRFHVGFKKCFCAFLESKKEEYFLDELCDRFRRLFGGSRIFLDFLLLPRGLFRSRCAVGHRFHIRNERYLVAFNRTHRMQSQF